MFLLFLHQSISHNKWTFYMILCESIIFFVRVQTYFLFFLAFSWFLALSGSLQCGHFTASSILRRKKLRIHIDWSRNRGILIRNNLKRRCFSWHLSWVKSWVACLCLYIKNQKERKKKVLAVTSCSFFLYTHSKELEKILCLLKN